MINRPFRTVGRPLYVIEGQRDTEIGRKMLYFDKYMNR